MSSIKAYLADKYMSGAKADAILAHAAQTKPKKKKRKADAATSSTPGASFIKDDDAGWGAADAPKEEDDDAMDAIVASDRAFKKRRTEAKDGESSWAVVREGEKEEPAEDEQPVVVEQEPSFQGGLLTSKQLKERAKRDASRPKKEAEAPPAQETIYRDATGRKIDTKAEKAEAARKKREREEKEKERLEWGKGTVQREEADAQRKKLEQIRGKDWVRRADDTELNNAQREEERWNDPAAAFLTVRLLTDMSRISLTCSAEEEGKGTTEAGVQGPPAAAKPL
jgi:pre-mRNA-splicing factor CWC26